MNDRTRKILVYGSLVGATIYGAYHFSQGGKSLTGNALPTVEPISASSQVAKPALKDRDLQQLQSAPWGSDPFYTSKRVTEVGSRLSWNLKGIVFNPTRPLAFINGTRVGVGDTVNSATVVAIERTKVTLTYQGTQFDVYVHKG